MKTREYGGISRVITEKVGETTWHGNLRDACRSLGIPLQLVVHKRGGRGAKNKYERIMICQAPFESGRVFFRKLCENFEDTVNEFCNLGHWTNDDIADAISMLFDEQVRVLAPNAAAVKDKWVTPARPLGFDSMWRRGAYSAAVDPANDPLGRFGREGPAIIKSRFDIGHMRNS
jgi:hypothetical protein